MSNENSYNGWSNRDTWLVMLWLENDESNYKRICNMRAGIGTNRSLSELTCCELQNKLRRFHYGDKIDWHNVNMYEIKFALVNRWE